MLFLQKINLKIKSIPYGSFYYCHQDKCIYTQKKHKICINKIKIKDNSVIYDYNEFYRIKNLELSDRLIYLFFMKIKKQPCSALDCLDVIKNNQRQEISNLLKKNNKLQVLRMI